MKETLLCKNLSLSIWFEPAPDRIKIRLVDKIAQKKAEVSAELSQNTTNKVYHLKEALVIAMRRAVSEAVKQGLISVNLGESATSVPDKPHGGLNITLSIDPE